MRQCFFHSLCTLVEVEPAEIRRRVQTAEGVMMVVDAMDANWVESESVRKAALRTLDLLIQPHDAINTSIVARGGLRFSLRALRAHPHDASMQSSACSKLYDVCLGQDKVARRVIAADALQAVTATLTNHTAEAEVEQRALRLIRHLLPVVMQQSQHDEQRHITPAFIRALGSVISVHPASVGAGAGVYSHRRADGGSLCIQVTGCRENDEEKRNDRRSWRASGVEPHSAALLASPNQTSCSISNASALLSRRPTSSLCGR